MKTLTTYHCGICGAQHNAPPQQLPAGWKIAGGAPICEDCSLFADNDRPDPIPAADYIRCETAQRTRSGHYIDLADPDCSVIQPIDIAAGLRQARFSAQTEAFYTVAQHCLLVLRLVSPLARKLGGDKGLQLKRCALMHDASEAFIHDITKPLKRQLTEYRPIEARFEQRLAARFGWEMTQFRREAVNLADLQALAIEQRDLIGNSDPWPILDQIDRDQLRSVTITRVWGTDEAEDRFLTAFEDLFPSEERKAA